MRFLLFTSLICIGLFAKLEAATYECVALTLQEAVTLALENSPDLQVLKQELLINDAEIKFAAVKINPNIITDSGIAEDTYRVGIEQTFELAAKRKKRVNVAKAERNRKNTELSVAIYELKKQVRELYVQLYILQERKKTYLKIINDIDRLLFFIEESSHLTNFNETDFHEIEALRLSYRSNLLEIKGLVHDNQATLNYLLNFPLDNEFLVSIPLSTFDTNINKQTFIDLALKENPILKLNLSTHELALKQIELSKANKIPNLSLTIGPDLTTPDSQSNFGVFVMTSSRLPILDTGAANLNLTKAKAAHVEKERNLLHKQITLKLTNAFNKYQINKERLNLLQTDLLPKIEKIENSLTTRLEDKKDIETTGIDILHILQIYVEAKSSYLKDLEAYYLSLMDLEHFLDD